MSTAVAEYGLAPPEMEDKVERVQTQLEWAKSLSIKTANEYAGAADALKGIKSLTKEIESCFGPLKQSASEAHKRIVAEEKKQLAPLVEAEALCKRAMLGYQQEEQRKADAERRRLQAIADEQARKERDALAKKAAAAKKPETRARYEEEAAAVAPAPVVHVEPVTPKVQGVTVRKTWKAELIDRAAFLKFVFEKGRDDLVIINEKALDAYAKSMTSNASMPGVRFTEVSTLASGGR